ncbi:hypothetical protein ACLK19_01435 [Escherichia coli]
MEPHRSGRFSTSLRSRADARARLRFGATWRVSPSDCLLNDLRGLIGSEQVELEFDGIQEYDQSESPYFEQPIAELEAKSISDCG